MLHLMNKGRCNQDIIVSLVEGAKYFVSSKLCLTLSAVEISGIIHLKKIQNKILY